MSLFFLNSPRYNAILFYIIIILVILTVRPDLRNDTEKLFTFDKLTLICLSVSILTYFVCLYFGKEPE